MSAGYDAVGGPPQLSSSQRMAGTPSTSAPSMTHYNSYLAPTPEVAARLGSYTGWTQHRSDEGADHAYPWRSPSAVMTHPHNQQAVAGGPQQQDEETAEQQEQRRALSAGSAGRPRHLDGTMVQPKGPLDECRVQSASEHVRTVFSTSNCMGIRSLPDALSPDFRQRLYDEMVAAAKRERQGQTIGRKADLSYGLEGGPLSMPLAVGQKQVARIHPLAGTFTQYEYIPSEYDRVKLMGKFERLKHKLQQVTPQEFVVKATPSGPRGAPAFSEFQYTLDPINAGETARRAENEVARSKVVAGPFYPSGSVQRDAVLKGRMDECLMGLCKVLSEDWPAAFLQVFEDRSGSVVASFDRSRAVQEGDLSSYMNQLAKGHHLVASYHLLKDASQWGLVDEDSQAVFYVLWPPWVRHRYMGQAADSGAALMTSLRRSDGGSISSEGNASSGGGAQAALAQTVAGGGRYASMVAGPAGASMPVPGRSALSFGPSLAA